MAPDVAPGALGEAPPSPPRAPGAWGRSSAHPSVAPIVNQGSGTPQKRALVLLLIAAAFGVAVALNLPLCPFALVTRHPCPGCGMTRAALALAQGHITEALRLHPLSIVVVPAAILLITQGSMSYVRRGRWETFESARTWWATALWLLFGLALFGVWIARFFGALGGPVPV
jgi:hypothetical protein